LSIAGLIVLAAIAGLAITGWIVASTGHNPGHRSFAVSVVNNRGEAVTIQPCERYFCDKFGPVDLPAGAIHTWQTTDGDAGVHSFMVEAAPHGRILGCLGQHGFTAVGEAVSVPLTAIERCVT